MYSQAGIFKNEGCIFIFILFLFGCGQSPSSDHYRNTSSSPVKYKVELDTILQGYTDSTCWFHPSIGIVKKDNGNNVMVMTIQKWLKGRSDVFSPILSRYSNDGGKTWSNLVNKNQAFNFRTADNGLVTGICNFTPKWHKKSSTLLGTCNSVPYRDKTLIKGRRLPAYSTYDEKNKVWAKWDLLQLPDDPVYYETNVCADQRVDLPDGNILLPIYFRAEEVQPFFTSIVKCSFDGEKLEFLEKGNNLMVNIDRGLFEPSLTKHGDRYYLTMRNDQKGYWSISEDGMQFSQPKVWHFDDGEEVGTYNTMQHWVTHSDGLFLVYTRKGADNDHIIRHRAPLFIAQVDTASMVLRRNTERVLVPERGVTLGNFGVSNINENETWVTVAELMRGKGEEKYGANGNVFAAKIKWENPNKTWSEN